LIDVIALRKYFTPMTNIPDEDAVFDLNYIQKDMLVFID